MLALDMADTLEDAGHVVVGPCVRFQDAQQVAAHEKFDGALLDVNLGEGETSEPIARLLRERGIPFAYVTAYSTLDIDGVRSDDVVIRKPVSQSLILEAIAGW